MGADRFTGSEYHMSSTGVPADTWRDQILEREGINAHSVDPFGDHFTINPNSAQERKNTPVYSGTLKYFPNALKEVAKASYQGQQQHNPNMPLHWDRAKSGDELDALTRHLIDHSVNPIDEDGVLHLSKVAWRALAALEKYLEGQDV